MAETDPRFPIDDPNSGFCSRTRVFHSLRPKVPLPPPSQPLSVTHYCFSLLRSAASNAVTTNTSTTCLINASTEQSLSYSDLISRTDALVLYLRRNFSLRKNDAAFILSPPSLNVPVLYLALLSLGIVVSPTNPLSSESEIAHQVQLSKPVIAFSTTEFAHKLPPLKFGTVLLDSPGFVRSLTQPAEGNGSVLEERIEVSPSDSAAIIYSSGTTGRVKGVLLTHRNLIATVGGYFHLQHQETADEEFNNVTFFTVPLFHVFGFFMLLRTVAMGETMVILERFDFGGMLRAVEKYRVSTMPVSPPLVVALTKLDITKKYDLSSLRALGCGGAPLGKDTAERFKKKFPDTELIQGYGLTETGGSVTRGMGEEEVKKYGSVGRLSENMEAKIVDPETGEALGPRQRGELWLRGPVIMKGYVGDEKATAETLDSEGWLKTGDLCYFDSDGLLYIVDRLKELIKYKAYQVPPAELEHILQSHPGITDVAVVPLPDEEAGQIPMAFVVRNPGSNVSEVQLMEFVAKQVAPYKKIRRVAFIDAIPKSPAGKILRRELRNHALSGARAKL